MLRKILIGIAAALALLVLVIAVQPTTFHVERSINVATAPERALALVNDFRAWTQWSPYEKKDPTMKRSYGGSASGTGATYHWVGNKDIGEGRMTILESTPSKVTVKLEFIEPFESTAAATFTFSPVQGGTKVSWAMDGNANFIGKAFHLVLPMDEIVGGDFEQGLSALKSAAERAPNPELANAR
jgi:hypothetical protein